MHELGLCDDIVEAVIRRAAGRPVARVRVRVGRLHRVHLDSFEQSFAIAAAGTVAEGALAEVVFVPVRGTCGDCGRSVEADEALLYCPVCGSLAVEQTGGDELLLEELEYRPVRAEVS
jgi:hydrogenase nickel incorporation protein HypA/HybF